MARGLYSSEDDAGDAGDPTTSRLRRAGRTGQRRLLQRLRSLELNGPQDLLEALNLRLTGFPSPPDTDQLLRILRERGAFLRATRPGRFRHDSLSPVWWALNYARLIVDGMIRDRDPRGPAARRALKLGLESFLVQARWHGDQASRLSPLSPEAVRFFRGTPNESDQAVSPDRKAARRHVAWGRNCHLAADLLLALWATDARWLRRLRRCQHPTCHRYFYDRAPAGHARACRPTCRKALNRLRPAASR